MGKILVVEDNPDNMDLITEILEDEGHEIFPTENVEDCFALLNRGVEVHVILMDGSLPTMDGFEATKILKSNEKFRKIPVIMLSAHAMPEDVDKGKAAGCNDYLTKPIVDEEQFLEVVNQYLPGDE